jgi:hypothetical protein
VEREGSGDASLNMHAVERRAALHGPAFELPTLHLSVLGLGVG